MDNPFLAVLSVWTHLQSSLTKIVRWGKHRARNPALRKQTNLEHTYAFMFLAMTALPKLKWFNPELDAGLILTCIHLHDVGEAETGTDTQFINKKQEIDVQEFLAFRQRMQALEIDVREELEAAFLLQFCLADHSLFPEDAQVVLKRLAKRFSLEAKIFAALERFDYVQYAYEGYMEHGDNVILTHVLRNQLPALEQYAANISGFDEIWKPEMNEWAKKFLAANEHVIQDQRAA